MVTPVGTATPDFGGNGATFSDTMEGVSPVESIQRQVFAAPATACR